jgi:multisubunit Na+/H+ antiporter MnhB subunit
MAETVTIQGQGYLKRNPLGVLGLGFITLGIYFLYWYYKANQEIQRYTGDQTISPTRSLLAVFPGGIVIVPALIAFYNTANHVVQMERQRGISSEISPAITVVIGLVFSIAVGIYAQEHLNRVWDSAAAGGAQSAAPPPPPPPVPA